MERIGVWFMKTMIWFLWDFSGLKYIYSKVLPPADKDTGERPPNTFLFWVIGVYIAVFGIASGRYENSIDIIEARANAIYTQLSTPVFKESLARIPSTQQFQVPVQPEILQPASVFQSMLGKSVRYNAMVDEFKSIIESRKFDLSEVDIEGIDLSSANLRGANLSKANLRKSNLSKALLNEANLSEAHFAESDLSHATLRRADLSYAYLWMTNMTSVDLREANMRGADLHEAILIGSNLNYSNLAQANLKNSDISGADLSNSTLDFANLNGANLKDTNLRGASFVGADLRGVIFSTIEQFSVSKTLYKAKLDPKLLDPIKDRYPELLQKLNKGSQ